MAVRHHLIHAAPREVWAVLADGSRYDAWVVGTSDAPVARARGLGPELDSAVEYTVRIGPWTASGSTVVRRVPFTTPRSTHCGPRQDFGTVLT
ncbi:hypothetical protein AB0892_07530 [Streptomyces sp. NPDC005409]|uniref:hypothetical protein n=1 Tax=Streptomyces sp. NPDC005409 TaxID=3155342 RepID=UPI003452375E